MTKTGVLVHVRHPETIGWTKLVWGVPAEDRLGDLLKLTELLLREAPTEPVEAIVMGTTSATKNGLLEGEYTKKYLLDHFDELWQFDRLKKLLNKLSKDQISKLKDRFASIIVTPIVKNTKEEIQEASRIFKEHDVRKVIQVSAASHGPRCIQLQAAARADGLIAADQLWFVAVTDMCFQDSSPGDTMIIEVPHRGDDPLTQFSPTLPQALKPFYYNLDFKHKKQLILMIDEFMKQHAKK